MGRRRKEGSNSLQELGKTVGTPCQCLLVCFWMVKRSEGSGHGEEPRHTAISPSSRTGAGMGMGYQLRHLDLVPISIRSPGCPPC